LTGSFLIFLCVWMLVSPACASDEGEYHGPRAAEPAWSPDGTRIVFSSDLRGSHDLWVVHLGTGTITQLTTDPEEGEVDPCWSPDGQSIYFRASRGEDVHLFRINADGTGETRVSPRNVWDYAVSPDNQHLVLAVGMPPDLILTSRSGEEIRYVAASEYGESQPRWSRSGTEVMFSRGGNLCRRNPFTLQWLGQVTLLPGEEFIVGYDWASTGRIVMNRSDANGLFTASTDGSGVAGFMDGDGNFLDLGWSADGRQLAFVFERNTDCDIWLVKADGTGLSRVTDLNAFQTLAKARPGKGPFPKVAKRSKDPLPRMFRPSLPPEPAQAAAPKQSRPGFSSGSPGRRSDAGDESVLVGLSALLGSLYCLFSRRPPFV
jgi:WD40 repeat protein